MENATKALIIAAGVLIGMMIISVGVALFTSFSDFSRSTQEKVDEAKISEWNNNYLKYYGTTTIEKNGKEEIKPIQLTAHDVISVANHAKQNNINYELQNQNRFDEKTYYVQVQVGSKTNFEKVEEQEKNTFLKENSMTSENEIKYYICTDVKISNITKRVMYIKFEEQ
ncbi:MAG: hypothetical protein GX682_04700 [Clostridiaceae bacterium]|nr:hypothetical protein [Clostridiaceae bacterium]